MFLFLFAGRATDVRSDDWKFPTEASSSQQFAEQCHQYFDHFVDLYKEHTSDPEVVRSEAIVALQVKTMTSVEEILPPEVLAISQDPLLEKKKDQEERLGRLILAGSNDPWILMAYAGHSGKQTNEARLRLIDQALANFVTSTYPPSLRFRLLLTRTSIARSMKDVEVERDSIRQLYRVLPGYLHYVGEHPGMKRVAIRSIRELFAHNRLLFDEGKQMIKQLTEEDDLDPWLVAMTRGHFLEQLGWRYRGGAFAARVDAKKMQQFHDAQIEAAEEILKAHELAPQYPEAAAQLISLASVLGSVGGRTEKGWFQQSLNAETDYLPAQQKMLWALRPRWGGSHEQMLQFGIEMARSDRYDTGLPNALIQAMYDAQSEVLDWRNVLNYEDVYPLAVKHLQLRLEQTEAAGEHHPQRDKYRTELMAIANLRGDYQDAMSWRQQAGDHLSQDVLRSFSLDSNAALSGLAARAEYGADNFTLLDQGDSEYLRINNPERYMEQIQAAVGDSPDEQAKPFVDQQLRLAKQASAYQAGDWVPLIFNEDFSDWVGATAQFDRVDDQTANVDMMRGRDIGLTHRLRTEGPREIEWSMAVVSGGDPVAPVGVQFGEVHGIWSGKGAGAALFFVDPSKSELGAYRNLDVEFTEHLYHAPRRMRIKAWGPKFEFYVNGKLIHAGELKSWDEVPDINGLTNGITFTGTLRIERVRVRKVDHLPCPDGEGANAEVAYYADRLQKDPDFPEYLHRYGVALQNSGKAELALVPLRRVVELDQEDVQRREAYARALLAAKDYAEAIVQHKRIAELTKNNPHWHGHSLSCYAMLLATVPDEELRDGRLAESLARQAFEFRKEDQAGLWKALACAQAEQGEFDSAMESIRQSRMEAVHQYEQEELDRISEAIKQQQPYLMAP